MSDMETRSNLFDERLQAFINAWQQLPKEEPKKPLSQQLAGLDDVKFQAFIREYDEAKKPMDLASELGFMTNVWKVAGIGSDELRNSKVLKWLLDWRGDHGQKNAILQQFLHLLPEPFKSLESNNYNTTAECCPLGQQESRVDIEIDADNFLLFIEIKVNASEGQDQLVRYRDIARAKANNRPWLVVYLTKAGKLPLQYQSEDGFVALSWKQITSLLNDYAKKSNENSRAAWLIRQFAIHINSF